MIILVYLSWQVISMYDLKQLIEMFDIPERTIRRHIKLGFLEGEKVKNKWLYTNENIKKYLDRVEVRKTLKNKSILAVNDYFYGFSRNSEDVCIIKHFKGLDSNKILELSNFINSMTSPFKFSINPIGNSHTVVFIGDLADSERLLEYFMENTL